MDFTAILLVSLITASVLVGLVTYRCFSRSFLASKLRDGYETVPETDAEGQSLLSLHLPDQRFAAYVDDEDEGED